MLSLASSSKFFNYGNRLFFYWCLEVLLSGFCSSVLSCRAHCFERIRNYVTEAFELGTVQLAVSYTARSPLISNSTNFEFFFSAPPPSVKRRIDS